jgi:predicted Zn-dependent protease
MEQEYGSVQEARSLFRKGLLANPRSRFTFLAWGSMEQELGNLERARAILVKGLSANPVDPALYQVSSKPSR